MMTLDCCVALKFGNTRRRILKVSEVSANLAVAIFIVNELGEGLKNIFNIVTCISIASKRLGKHISAKRTDATEGRPLLGNGPVNTPP
jgi:hypothetical protein